MTFIGINCFATDVEELARFARRQLRKMRDRLFITGYPGIV